VSEQRYKPYGEVRWSSGAGMPTDLTFTGQRAGPPGYVGSLTDYVARFYSPALGRFISADTIVPGAGNGQAFNRYSYALNSPLVFLDPTGHSVCQTAEDCYELGTTPKGVFSDPAIATIGNYAHDGALHHPEIWGMHWEARGPLSEAVVDKWLSRVESYRGNVERSDTYSDLGDESFFKADLVTLDRTPPDQWTTRQQDLAYGRSLGAAGAMGVALPGAVTALITVFLPGYRGTMAGWEDISRNKTPQVWIAHGVSVKEFAGDLGDGWVQNSSRAWSLDLGNGRVWTIYNGATTWGAGATAQLAVDHNVILKYRFGDFYQP